MERLIKVSVKLKHLILYELFFSFVLLSVIKVQVFLSYTRGRDEKFSV